MNRQPGGTKKPLPEGDFVETNASDRLGKKMKKSTIHLIRGKVVE
jgi:hypothetical protein